MLITQTHYMFMSLLLVFLVGGFMGFIIGKTAGWYAGIKYYIDKEAEKKLTAGDFYDKLRDGK